jgi:hypothetical protein
MGGGGFRLTMAQFTPRAAFSSTFMPRSTVVTEPRRPNLARILKSMSRSGGTRSKLSMKSCSSAYWVHGRVVVVVGHGRRLGIVHELVGDDDDVLVVVVVVQLDDVRVVVQVRDRDDRVELHDDRVELHDDRVELQQAIHEKRLGPQSHDWDRDLHRHEPGLVVVVVVGVVEDAVAVLDGRVELVRHERHERRPALLIKTVTHTPEVPALNLKTEVTLVGDGGPPNVE